MPRAPNTGLHPRPFLCLPGGGLRAEGCRGAVSSLRWLLGPRPQSRCTELMVQGEPASFGVREHVGGGGWLATCVATPIPSQGALHKRRPASFLLKGPTKFGRRACSSSWPLRGRNPRVQS